MPLLLFLMAFLLPPGAGAGEIIGGREARPHSHPYMAFLIIEAEDGTKACGGFLVRSDFVLTAAHCWGRTISVIMGAHNVRSQERTQQRTRALRAIRHPDYNPQTSTNDIMLLQVKLTVQRDSKCSNRFSFYNSQTQICVGDPRRRKSAFLGDSGGPLVCNGVAQGIVSYGDRRGTPPAVFTRIASFMPWVNRTMRRFKQQCQT